MSFVDAIVSGFRNFFNFRGRATRAEFWYWILFVILLGLVLGTLDSVIWPVAPISQDWMQALDVAVSQPTPLSNIANLILFIPGLSLTARRFHDAGFSAKWLLLHVIPLAYAIFAVIGAIVVTLDYVDRGLLVGGIESVPVELWMSYIFLILPIFALSAVVFLIHLIFTLKPSRSFYDGNKYVEPTPLGPIDEGTTA